MGLKRLMKTCKEEGYVLKKLDRYLLKMNDKDIDRRYDINSPSSAGACPRSIAYSRLGYEPDDSVDARTRRIFDNGTHTHIRLQRYLLDEGILAMDEVPVFYDDLQIQGHTDGLLTISKFEGAILEIKSINNEQFTKLIDAKEEHKVQAQVYMYCLEMRRLYLRERFSSNKELEDYLNSEEYVEFIRNHYKHLKDGEKYTAEEKFNFKLNCHKEADRLVFVLSRPINKMVFVYENKNNQEIKEYCVKWNQEFVDDIIEKFTEINEAVLAKKLPTRPEGVTKSCSTCRWCKFKSTCFVI